MARRAFHLVLALSTLAGVSAALADDPPDEIAFWAAVRASGKLEHDPARGQPFRLLHATADPGVVERCTAFLARYPRSPRIVDVLQALAAYENHDPGARVEALIRIREDYPEEFAARQLATAFSASWAGVFATVPTRVAAEVGLSVEPRTPAPTTYVTYRIPPGRYQDILRDPGPPRSDRDCALSVPRASWDKLDEATLVKVATYTVPGSTQPGWYVLEESIAGCTRVHVTFVRTFEPYVLRCGRELLIYATDNAGVPIADYSLETPTGTLLPGREGLIRAAIDEGTRLVVVRGDEAIRILVPSVEVQPATFGSASRDNALYFVSTDRPLYRPGHVVRYHVVRRDQREGRLVLPANAPRVIVQVMAPDGRVLARESPAWTAAGTTSGAFVLAREPRLGRYELQVVDEDDVAGFSRFRVQAYQRPEFHLSAEPDRARARPGADTLLRLRAQYDYGTPVAGADVEWTAAPVLRDWRLDLARRMELVAPAPFEDPHRWCYTSESRASGHLRFHEHDVSGSGRLGPDGTLAIALSRPEGVELAGWYFRATVVDAAGRGHEIWKRIAIAASDFAVTAAADSNFVPTGASISIRARLSSVSGVPVAGRVAELVVSQVVRTVDASDQALVLLDPVAIERVPADATGYVRFDVRPRGVGRFEYRVRVVDDMDREAVAHGDLVVVGSEAPSGPARAPWSDARLDVLPERLSYQAGSVARFLIHTDRVPARALVVVSAARIEARWVELRHADQVVELPMPRESASTFVRVRTHEGLVSEDCVVEVAIVPVHQSVDVAVRFEASALTPRGKARLVVETLQAGRPIAAEVALSIADHELTEPEERASGPSWSDVGSDGDLIGDPRIDRSFRDGYQRPRHVPARGGTTIGSDDDTTPLPAGARHLPDTWHWDAHLATGADGRASIELDVPDVLTRWRVLARAVAGADGFGSAATWVSASQPVVLRLVGPRFLVAGDEATLTTLLTSDVAGTFAVTVVVDGRALPAVEVELAPAGTASHSWPVAAGEAGTLALTAKAVGAAGSDASELAIPVHARATLRAESASGVVSPRWTAELTLPAGAAAERAWVDVHVTDPRSLASLSESLSSLSDCSSGDLEQIVCRFLPALVLARAMERHGLAVPPELATRLPGLVSVGLQRLNRLQREDDGAWGLWDHDSTTSHSTAVAVHALLVAQRVGVYVDPALLERGLEGLRAFDLTPQAMYLLTLAGEDVAALRDTFDAADDGARAWLVLAGRKELAGRLSGTPPQEVTSESIQRVAVVIRALAAVDPRDPRLPPLIDWLGLQRRDGKWVSALDTAQAISALCEVCAPAVQRTIAVTVNGRQVPLVRGHGRAPAISGANEVAVSQTGALGVAASAFLRYVASDPGWRALAPLTVTRRLSSGDDAVTTGAEIHVEVEVTARVAARRVLVECPIPAGCEASVDEDSDENRGPLEVRDDRVCVALLLVPKDEPIRITFRLRALQPGVYHLRPVTAVGVCDPEVTGTSESGELRITER